MPHVPSPGNCRLHQSRACLRTVTAIYPAPFGWTKVFRRYFAMDLSRHGSQWKSAPNGGKKSSSTPPVCPTHLPPCTAPNRHNHVTRTGSVFLKPQLPSGRMPLWRSITRTRTRRPCWRRYHTRGFKDFDTATHRPHGHPSDQWSDACWEGRHSLAQDR